MRILPKISPWECVLCNGCHLGHPLSHITVLVTESQLEFLSTFVLMQQMRALAPPPTRETWVGF